MTRAQRILAMAKGQPLVRPRDIEARGIARESLLRLYRQGLLVRWARGVYSLPESSITAHHSLAIGAKRTPGGVICRGLRSRRNASFTIQIVSPTEERIPGIRFRTNSACPPETPVPDASSDGSAAIPRAHPTRPENL